MRAILQSEAAECGLACLGMVCAAHGRHIDMVQLRRRFSTSLKGATLRQLIDQAAMLGFTARPVRSELGELRQLQVPCVLHWDFNHFVVLARITRRSALILDPAIGARRLALDDVSRHFTGVALELTPNADFTRHEAKPRLRIRDLAGRVRGLARSLAQILIVAIVLEAFALLTPLFGQMVVDDVLTSGDRDLLAVLVLGFGLLLVIQTAVGLARSWMVMVLGQTVSLQWLGNVFAHMVKLPVDFFERRHLGDVVSRFGSIHAIQKTLTTSVVEAALDGLMAFAALAMMVLYSPALACVTMVAVAAYGLLRWAFYRPLRDASAERLVLAARESTHFIETLRAMTPLKLFGREEERRAAWQNLIVDVQNRDVRTARLNILFGTANTFIFGLEGLVVMAIGARVVLSGQNGSGPVFSVGMLMAFLAYRGQFSSRVSALINDAVDFKMLQLHAERLADIALATPERDHPQLKGAEALAPSDDLAHLEPSIELRGVGFRYGDGEPCVVRGVDWFVGAGESVALTGPSGCGKTTVLKIMLGLLAPTEGEVLYGGLPVSQLGIRNVRRLLGTVMQEDVLLTGSIEENIAFFDPQPDRARVEAAARMARIHADVLRMPMGYRTLLGDLGTGLSGGQRQRILLARALYKQPRILALDEATSHLDDENERAINAALAELRITRVVIAHRAGTIAAAQRRVVIRDRAIVEVRSLPQTATGALIAG